MKLILALVLAGGAQAQIFSPIGIVTTPAGNESSPLTWSASAAASAAVAAEAYLKLLDEAKRRAVFGEADVNALLLLVDDKAAFRQAHAAFESTAEAVADGAAALEPSPGGDGGLTLAGHNDAASDSANVGASSADGTSSTDSLDCSTGTFEDYGDFDGEANVRTAAPRARA